jgi:hypothetical protein
MNADKHRLSVANSGNRMFPRIPPHWFGLKTRPGAILALVMLFELTLLVDVHGKRWVNALPQLGRDATKTGEGLVVRSDGLGYYAWLRSLLIDGDWQFDNEFDGHNVVGDYVPQDRTETGRRANPWSVGPACAWSVAVVPGHLLVQAFQWLGCPWPADGYSLPYQLLVAASSLLICWLGLVMIAGICRIYTDPNRAALTAAFLVTGTNIIYYSSVEVSMAHGIGTAVVAVLVWYWLKTYGQMQLGRWFLVGLLVGAAALVRWQLVTLAVLPAGEAVLTARRCTVAIRSQAQDLVRAILAAAFAALLVFTPQMIAWKIVYGHCLASPIAVSHNWLHPPVWQVLFGQDRGLFSWTPLAALALLGFLGAFLPRRRQPAGPQEPLLLLVAAFLVQVYVLASLWGTGVYLGVAYGFRHLTEVQVLLAPGLALLLERASARGFRLATAVACLLVLWNLLLLCQYRLGLLPADQGTDLATRLHSGVRLLWRKPVLRLEEVAFVPLLLWAAGSQSVNRPRSCEASRVPLT